VNRLRRLTRFLRGWLHSLLAEHYPQLVQHLPRVRIRTDPWVPAWALRLVVAAIGWLCVAPLDLGGVAALSVAVLLGVIVVIPGGVLPATLAIVVGLLVVLTEEPSTTRTAWLLLGLHGAAQLGALVGQAGPLARIELRSLLRPLPAFVGVQLVSQPLALLGGWLAGLNIELTALPVVAALAVAALVFGWMPQLTGSGPRARS
jgi:hypothetical protein